MHLSRPLTLATAVTVVSASAILKRQDQAPFDACRNARYACEDLPKTDNVDCSSNLRECCVTAKENCLATGADPYACGSLMWFCDPGAGKSADISSNDMMQQVAAASGPEASASGIPKRQDEGPFNACVEELHACHKTPGTNHAGCQMDGHVCCVKAKDNCLASGTDPYFCGSKQWNCEPDNQYFKHSGIEMKREVPDVSSLPPCGRWCVESMLEKAGEFGCDDNDMDCLCGVHNFLYGMRDCTIQGCPFDDQMAALDFGVSHCTAGLSSHAGFVECSTQVCCENSDSLCRAEPSVSDSECDGIMRRCMSAVEPSNPPFGPRAIQDQESFVPYQPPEDVGGSGQVKCPVNEDGSTGGFCSFHEDIDPSDGHDDDCLALWMECFGSGDKEIKECAEAYDQCKEVSKNLFAKRDDCDDLEEECKAAGYDEKCYQDALDACRNDDKPLPACLDGSTLQRKTEFSCDEAKKYCQAHPADSNCQLWNQICPSLGSQSSRSLSTNHSQLVASKGPTTSLFWTAPACDGVVEGCKTHKSRWPEFDDSDCEVMDEVCEDVEAADCDWYECCAIGTASCISHGVDSDKCEEHGKQCGNTSTASTKSHALFGSLVSLVGTESPEISLSETLAKQDRCDRLVDWCKEFDPILNDSECKTLKGVCEDMVNSGCFGSDCCEIGEDSCKSHGIDSGKCEKEGDDCRQVLGDSPPSKTALLEGRRLSKTTRALGCASQGKREPSEGEEAGIICKEVMNDADGNTPAPEHSVITRQIAAPDLIEEAVEHFDGCLGGLYKCYHGFQGAEKDKGSCTMGAVYCIGRAQDTCETTHNVTLGVLCWSMFDQYHNTIDLMAAESDSKEPKYIPECIHFDRFCHQSGVDASKCENELARCRAEHTDGNKSRDVSLETNPSRLFNECATGFTECTAKSGLKAASCEMENYDCCGGAYQDCITIYHDDIPFCEVLHHRCKDAAGPLVEGVSDRASF